MMIPNLEPKRTQGRLKILRVTRMLLTAIFQQNRSRQFVIVNGLPHDAELVGISEHADFSTGGVALKFRSDEWEEVPEGHAIPEVRIAATMVDLVRILNDALMGKPI
jgi:hypothetical protein